MKYSIMVLLVKHEGTNEPVALMDEVSKYHLDKLTSIKRDIKDFKDLPREEVSRSQIIDIDKWLKDEDKKLYYFGISGEELKKILS